MLANQSTTSGQSAGSGALHRGRVRPWTDSIVSARTRFWQRAPEQGTGVGALQYDKRRIREQARFSKAARWSQPRVVEKVRWKRRSGFSTWSRCATGWGSATQPPISDARCSGPSSELRGLRCRKPLPDLGYPVIGPRDGRGRARLRQRRPRATPRSARQSATAGAAGSRSCAPAPLWPLPDPCARPGAGPSV